MRPNPRFFLARFFAPLLSLGLALPDVSFALRQNIEGTTQAGLEEALRPIVAAGLEEERRLSEALEGAAFQGGARLMKDIIRWAEKDLAAAEAATAGFYEFSQARLPDSVGQDSNGSGHLIARFLRLAQRAPTSPPPAWPRAGPSQEESAGSDGRQKSRLLKAPKSYFPWAGPKEFQAGMKAARERLATAGTDEEEEKDPPSKEEIKRLEGPLHQGLHAENILRDYSRLVQEAEDLLVRLHHRLILACMKDKGITRDRDHQIFEDVRQGGYLALLNAIRNYNPNQGTAFSTYAYQAIRREIHDTLQAMSRRLRIQPDDLELFFKTAQELEKKQGIEPGPEEIAEVLEKESSWAEAISHWRQNPDSLNRPVGDAQLLDLIEPEPLEPEWEEIEEEKRGVRKVLEAVRRESPDGRRDALVLKLYYELGTRNGPYTQEWIAKRTGITPQRVSQIIQDGIQTAQERLELTREGRVEPIRPEAPGPAAGVASGDGRDNDADVYLIDVMGIPYTSPLFEPLSRLKRRDLEKIQGALSAHRPFPLKIKPGESFPRRLTRIRQFYGLTSKAAAQGAGVSATTYSAWENGRQLPKGDSLKRLARFYAEAYRLHPDAVQRYLGMRSPWSVLRKLKGKPSRLILKGLRVSQWHSAEGFARAALPGMNPKSYVLWEKGRNVPPLAFLRRIVSFYVRERGFPQRSLERTLGIPSPKEVLKELKGRPLPEILRGLRESVPLTIAELASLAKIGPRTVTRWEKGEVVPLPANLRKPAEVYARGGHFPEKELLALLDIPSTELFLQEIASRRGDGPKLLDSLEHYLGLSQSGMARLVGVEKSTYRFWKQGRIKPPLSRRYQMVARLAEEGRLPVEPLREAFGLDGPEKTLSRLRSMPFPKALRHLRWVYGIGMSKVAGRLGVSRFTYRGLEKRGTLPARYLPTLAAYYSGLDGLPSPKLLAALEAGRQRWQSADRVRRMAAAPAALSGAGLEEGLSERLQRERGTAWLGGQA